jgi:hypothetical protein
MSADHNYGELEIGLHRAQRGVYEVALRLTDPQSQAEVAPVRGLAEIDAEALLAALHDPDKYGRLLSAQVFADAALRQLYGKARVALERGGLMLRIRIAVEATALELHDLRWELLRDPETDAPLATSERIVLSRFMRGADWRRIRMQPRARLRALVAVAAPANLTDYRLAAIDIDGEVARATAALAGVELRVLGKAEPLTLERLIDALRAGADLVYLVCHGTLTRQLEPLLFLQREDGQAAPVKGAELARRIGELQQVPRLIVLASCESAGNEAAADASLAPLLADAGVPAVLAMQGKISMETVRLVMPHFFRELLLDGQIDRALAAARGAARARPDHWVPALFLRLRSGRMWYEPGLTGGRRARCRSGRRCVSASTRGASCRSWAPTSTKGLFGGVRALAVRHGDGARLSERGARARPTWRRLTQFLSAERRPRHSRTGRCRRGWSVVWSRASRSSVRRRTKLGCRSCSTPWWSAAAAGRTRPLRRARPPARRRSTSRRARRRCSSRR